MRNVVMILPVMSQNQMDGLRYVEKEWAAGVKRKPRESSMDLRRAPLVSGSKA